MCKELNWNFACGCVEKVQTRCKKRSLRSWTPCEDAEFDSTKCATSTWPCEFCWILDPEVNGEPDLAARLNPTNAKLVRQRNVEARMCYADESNPPWFFENEDEKWVLEERRVITFDGPRYAPEEHVETGSDGILFSLDSNGCEEGSDRNPGFKNQICVSTKPNELILKMQCGPYSKPRSQALRYPKFQAPPKGSAEESSSAGASPASPFPHPGKTSDASLDAVSASIPKTPQTPQSPRTSGVDSRPTTNGSGTARGRSTFQRNDLGDTALPEYLRSFERDERARDSSRAITVYAGSERRPRSRFPGFRNSLSLSKIKIPGKRRSNVRTGSPSSESPSTAGLSASSASAGPSGQDAWSNIEIIPPTPVKFKGVRALLGSSNHPNPLRSNPPSTEDIDLEQALAAKYQSLNYDDKSTDIDKFRPLSIIPESPRSGSFPPSIASVQQSQSRPSVLGLLTAGLTAGAAFAPRVFDVNTVGSKPSISPPHKAEEEKQPLLGPPEVESKHSSSSSGMANPPPQFLKDNPQSRKPGNWKPDEARKSGTDKCGGLKSDTRKSQPEMSMVQDQKSKSRRSRSQERRYTAAPAPNVPRYRNDEASEPKRSKSSNGKGSKGKDKAKR